MDEVGNNMSAKELVSSRSYYKGAITRIKNYLDGARLSEVSVDVLHLKKDRLKQSFESYIQLCVRIKALDSNDNEDPGEVEDTYVTLLAKLNNLVKTGSKISSTIKLPNVEIPKFSGKYTEFLEFYSLFDALIGSNETITPVQKLYYLKNFLTDEPLILVNNLPLLDSSYLVAIKILKERYDNKFKIVNEHINLLLEMNVITRSTPSALRAFISGTKQHLAALKNLDEPVDTWDSILVCVLSKKLDLISNRAYQLERDVTKKPTIEDFLIFLERRALALENTETITQKPQRFASNVVTTGNATERRAPSCSYCKLSHKLFACPKFKLAAIDKRLQFVNTNKLCNICLNLHKKRCRLHFKCSICKQSHNTLLHKDDPNVVCPTPSVTLLAGALKGQVLLPTARVKLISQTGTTIYCRTMLDSGSQASFVTRKLADLLGGIPNVTNSNIIGITKAQQTITQSINIEIHSLVYPFKTSLNCYIVPEITTRLPQKEFDISHITIPQKFQLADENFNKPGDIHLLIGADIFFQILLPSMGDTESDTEIRNPDQLRLVNTALGYIVAGRTPSDQKQNQVISLACFDCKKNTVLGESLSKFWESEQVEQIYPESLPEFQFTEKHFQKTVILKDNKFQVTMPLKVPLNKIHNELGNSFHLALCRFLNLEKRFLRDQVLFKEYKKFIDQYIELGHGKYIHINQYDLTKDPVYFLPHHPVIREDSKTTKLRVVFDGSMKTDKKVSLNDMLLNGSVVQKDLFDILIAFRMDKYFFISDVKMMFRYISLDPSQRSLQNILWRDQPNEDIRCIQLQTVTYGLKTSTYNATRCLIELAQKYQRKLPLAASVLKNNTYVDDILVTCHSKEDLVKTQHELIKLLSLGSFQLHKWSSNCDEVLSNVPKDKQHFGELDLQRDELSVKTLGVNFDIRSDTFKLHTAQQYTITQYTKREILSFISKFFDPLGLMGPIFVQAKLIMQSLWAANLHWDDSLSGDILLEWIEFSRSLLAMKPIHIQRCINPVNASVVQLIGFADASKIAHGCCLYLKVIDEYGNISVNLLCSRSRINSHKNQLTIPRWELNAALLLVKLTNKVLPTLKAKGSVQCTYLLIDSQIVLAWIDTDINKLNTYVANRVRVIQELTLSNCCQWGYIDTNENPADCISRGLLPHELKCHKLWWHGPGSLLNKNFLLVNRNNKLVEIPELRALNENLAVPDVCTAITIKSNYCVISDIIGNYSDINKMIRILAYILRYCKNSRPNSIKNKEPFLSVTELDTALLKLIKFEQNKFYHNEIRTIQSGNQVSGSLKSLHIFIDKHGIMRVGGRLQNASLPYSKIHPVLLPKRSTITELIIRHEHLRLLHAGQRLVLSSINQKYWIIDGLRTVKKILHKCVTCFRLKAAATSQLMGSLPADRVNACRPFEKIGMDFAGPISVKLNRFRRATVGKGYILVIVCFVTKAIHLELASDLTTDTFLACLRRFIARRNLPSDVYCDNASTFKGARTRLGDLYRFYGGDKDHRVQVQSFASQRGLRFHFAPCYSPIFGGLHEASVKSVKYHLKRVMGRALLTYEQLNTVLVEIEAVLNSRPICAMSVDPTDFSYLTPGHFLTGSALNSYPEQDVSDTPTNLLKFWTICTNMKQVFWKHWKNVYLTTLQNRPKWHSVTPNITTGSLVILREMNTSPLQWPMARVTNVFPGADGAVRAIEVTTSNGRTHRRSVTKVCVLPIDNV